MNVNSIDGNFSTEYFALGENNQPLCTDRFLQGLQVLASQATSAINNHKAVEEAFERIQEAKWEHISTEAKKIVDQRIQDVRQAWVKVCFNKQYRHVSREHLTKNCGPKFHAQYSNPMKDATQLELNLLPPNGFLADDNGVLADDNGVLADDYDQTIIKAFLDYIQTGTLSENALNDNILQLFILAHQHQIEGLIIKCTDLLKEQLDDHENLDTIWEFANEQKIPQLKFACLSYMQANQDNISTELKEKYEKALPVIKALFANEIILNQSPSGNIEVKIEIFNEETASHIEQLSKLFSIKSLVISENCTATTIYVPIATEIYCRGCTALTTLDAPKATAIYSQFCTALTTLHAPEATIIYCQGCTALTTLEASNATMINCSGCTVLTTIGTPEATEIHCRFCTALTSIYAPKATVINCQICTALKTLHAPEATLIHCQGCTALTTIYASEETKIDRRGCTALKKLNAPKANMIT